MTLQTRLKTACKRKGLTVRLLGDQLGVSYKTAHRFITGESSIPEEKSRILIRLLFDDAEKRESIRVKLKERRQESKEEKRLRNDRKKSVTFVSKFLEARPWVTDGVGVSEESSKIISSFAESQISPFDVREIAYLKGGDRSAGVVIIDRRIQEKRWNQIAIINSEEMTLWDNIEENKVSRIVVDFSKNADEYFRFCKKKNLGYYALLDFAKDKVESSEILDEQTDEKSKSVRVGKDRLDLLKREITGVREWIKGGKEPKVKMINKLGYWEAEMDVWLNSAKAIKKARQKLVHFIDSMSEDIRKYSPQS